MVEFLFPLALEPPLLFDFYDVSLAFIRVDTLLSFCSFLDNVDYVQVLLLVVLLSHPLSHFPKKSASLQERVQYNRNVSSIEYVFYLLHMNCVAISNNCC